MRDKRLGGGMEQLQGEQSPSSSGGGRAEGDGSSSRGTPEPSSDLRSWHSASGGSQRGSGSEASQSEAEAEAPLELNFDRAATSRHAYLGGERSAAARCRAAGADEARAFSAAPSSQQEVVRHIARLGSSSAVLLGQESCTSPLHLGSSARLPAGPARRQP